MNVRPIRKPHTPAEVAGAMAATRARQFGYCNTTADSLRRAAMYDHRPGETPEQTAERVVAAPDSIVTGTPTLAQIVEAEAAR